MEDHKLNIETLEKFEEWNHEIIRDIYFELRGFYGTIRSYNHLVRELYMDTYALSLALNDSDMLHKYRLFPFEHEFCDEDHGEESNKESIRIYNEISDFQERIQFEIIGGYDILISKETIWHMGHEMPKRKKNGYQHQNDNHNQFTTST